MARKRAEEKKKNITKRIIILINAFLFASELSAHWLKSRELANYANKH